MLKLNDFKRLSFNSNSLDYFRGGATRTGSGTKSYTNSSGQNCSFDYGYDCKTETSNGWIVKYCDRSETNCQ